MRPMSERTLEYGTNSREDLYKALYTVLNNRVPLTEVPGYSALDMGQKRGLKVALDNFADVIVHLAHMSSARDGQINPVHRPVIEQLMADLQAMLDKMPPEEKPNTVKPQLQRISDGAIFNVLGTKIGGRGQLNSDGSGAKNPDGDIVWLQQVDSPHGPFGHGNDHLRDSFTVYPPQKKPKPEGMFHNA